MQNSNETFSGYSIALLQAKYPQILAWLKDNPYVSLVSELETKWNQIVTIYKEDAIKPLCIIGRDGLPRWGRLRSLCPSLFRADGFPL